MKETLIIAGFGGQGVLSMGKILAYSGVMQDFEVTWMPSYGPEMRGGTANVTVILSDRKISSPIAHEFDTAIILNQQSMEKFEPMVRPGGVLIYDTNGITRQSVHTPANVRKCKKAIRKAFENSMAGKGFSLVEVVSTCNSGWKLSPVASNEWLEQNMLPFYPLGDIKDVK